LKIKEEFAMYHDYWGLHKPAFDNVPDPSMYVDCHASMENAIAETLFAIEEGDECIAVIVGDVGLGKTMSLRMIIDSLAQEKYRIALITNPGVTFGQILQEIIGQLTGQQCLEKRKVQLLETFNRLLFSTLEEGRKILVFIDEANAIRPINLENLRLLTNMQGDRRNLFTMVLAGQIEFARRLEHPKRANLFQRVGTYCRIDRLESVEEVRKYVEARLLLAGATRRIFAEDAFDQLWEQSDRGVPRLVNKVAKLCLKAGETNQFEWITGEMVEQIGSRFHKLAGPAIQKRRARTTPRRTVPGKSTGETARQEAGETFTGKEREPDHPPQPDVVSAGLPVFTSDQDPQSKSLETNSRAEKRGNGAVVKPSPAGLLPFISFVPRQEPQPETDTEAEEPASGTIPEPSAAELLAFVPRPEPQRQPEPAETDTEEEMSIGPVRIRIQIPRHLLKQSRSASNEHRYRLAGGLAAETLKKNPELVSSLSADPVPIWLEIRDFVLNRMTHAGGI
jgi:type II secretory pathway predicted ATPase ExeA